MLFLFNIGIVASCSWEIDSLDHGYMKPVARLAARSCRSTASPHRRQTRPRLRTSADRHRAQRRHLGHPRHRRAGGIGRILDERRRLDAYGDVSVIILEILAVVILIEITSNLLRKRLV